MRSATEKKMFDLWGANDSVNMHFGYLKPTISNFKFIMQVHHYETNTKKTLPSIKNLIMHNRIIAIRHSPRQAYKKQNQNKWNEAKTVQN